MAQRSKYTPKSPSASLNGGGDRRNALARVTIRDVAEQAGVGLGTASNVLNRPDRVAPETLARVREVIERLGFVRSSAAHQMRGGHSRCFGAVVLDASDPFSTGSIRGVEDSVHEQGCAVVVCSTDGSHDREARYLRLLEEQRVQGIVITPASRSIRHLQTLRDRGTAAVLLDRKSTDGEFCSVSVDHPSAAASWPGGTCSTWATVTSSSSMDRSIYRNARNGAVGYVGQPGEPALMSTTASASTRSTRSPPSSRLRQS